jgi:hypothetical protein
VRKGDGSDSDSNRADADENIGEEEGRYKKVTFFLDSNKSTN